MMSDYIQSTSNPEGLFVSDGAGEMVRLGHRVASPLASRRKEIAVPKRLFFQACRARPVGTQRIRDGVLRIEEVFVFLDTAKRVPIPRCGAPDVAERAKAYLIRFGYGGDFVYLWRVTWEQVVGAVLRKDEAERADPA